METEKSYYTCNKRAYFDVLVDKVPASIEESSYGS